jgi:hypothetical protein
MAMGAAMSRDEPSARLVTLVPVVVACVLGTDSCFVVSQCFSSNVFVVSLRFIVYPSTQKAATKTSRDNSGKKYLVSVAPTYTESHAAPYRTKIRAAIRTILSGYAIATRFKKFQLGLAMVMFINGLYIEGHGKASAGHGPKNISPFC